MQREVAEAVLQAYARYGPKISADSARSILRAWLASRGMTEDRYGNFKDAERSRVHFSGTKVYDQGKNANGDWATRKSWSLIDAATSTVALAAETTGETELAEKLRGKKKQRVEQRKTQAAKRERSRAEEALHNQALVVASQEMPEQFVESVVDGVEVPELDERVVDLQRKFAWLRERGTPVTADQFMSVDEPPIAPLFIDVALTWTETVDVHPYTMQIVHAHGRERTAKVQIGLSDDSAMALEVDPFSHGISMTAPPRERHGDAYMSGWLSWTDAGPQAGMFFLASHEKQKGAGGRVLDLWCRMLSAYGVTTWKAEAVGDEGRAFLAAKARAGRLQVIDEVGSSIFVRCIENDLRQGRLALNPAGYYSEFSGLDDTISRWQRDGEKLYDDSQPVLVAIDDLWPYREYPWRRGYSRGSVGEWDELVEKMRGGWDPEKPLMFVIGRRGGAKVGEGNHRLAIARGLGMTAVPVEFHYNIGPVEKQTIPVGWQPR